MDKFTSETFESLANDIVNFLKEHDMFNSVRIYYNNKCIDPNKGIIEDISPKDYFEYANPKTLSMSFEGSLYDLINYGYDYELLEKFNALFDKYGLYYELGYAWSLSAYCKDCSDKCNRCEKETEEKIYMYRHVEGLPEELANIQNEWSIKANSMPDIGSCVIGAGFDFIYKGKKYFMPPCSKNQGSITWETFKDEIEDRLKDIGCINIRYDWGNID